ncbi:hypothetical protein ACN4EE_09925 [Geminocystis sp. CENA526]|uniref:hypothetical protein n=1 Tax=Geminocystis sp. CENA526 TaxID=1355871 RepID=UPI003D6F68A6
MKNQALVITISGLLIGGFGIANKVEILKIAGTGLLFSSVTLTLIEDKKQTQPKLDTPPQNPPTFNLPPKPKNPQPSTNTAKPIIPTKPKKPQIIASTKTEKPVLSTKPKKPQIITSTKTEKPVLSTKPQIIASTDTEKPVLLPKPTRPVKQLAQIR